MSWPAWDGLLLGKNTFEAFASYWPSQKGDGFADPINKMPKYVVLHKPAKDGTGITAISSAMWTEDVAALKQSSGGDILVYGSATLVKSLMHHDLVDELRLMVHPLSIGGGFAPF
jgi:dihydrofolate reductase